LARVGDHEVRVKTTLLQFQQAQAPGVRVSMLFETEQITIAGPGIDPDEHRLAGLENLVMGADPDAAKVLSFVYLASRGDRGLENIEDAAQRHAVVEQIAQ